MSLYGLQHCNNSTENPGALALCVNRAQWHSDQALQGLEALERLW